MQASLFLAAVVHLAIIVALAVLLTRRCVDSYAHPGQLLTTERPGSVSLPVVTICPDQPLPARLPRAPTCLFSLTQAAISNPIACTAHREHILCTAVRDSAHTSTPHPHCRASTSSRSLSTSGPSPPRSARPRAMSPSTPATSAMPTAPHPCRPRAYRRCSSPSCPNALEATAARSAALYDSGCNSMYPFAALRRGQPVWLWLRVRAQPGRLHGRRGAGRAAHRPAAVGAAVPAGEHHPPADRA